MYPEISPLYAFIKGGEQEGLIEVITTYGKEQL